MIELLSPSTVLDRTARSLALNESQTSPETVAAQSLRRAVSTLAPCSRSEALRFAQTPLRGVIDESDDWFEALLEALIAYGDVLEVTPQDQDAWRTGRLVLRPAPPSFVRRPNGDVIILGVAGDAPTALLGDLAARLEHQGPLRTLRQPLAATAIDLLTTLGLIELSEAAWLRAPVTMTAHAYSDISRAELANTPISTAPLEGLTLIDPAASVTFYTGRWRPPAPKDTGVFVARRQQMFGLRPWCLVELDRGQPRRLLDLLAGEDGERPCDRAWRMQAAFDASAGRPQQIRVNRKAETVELEFFSPLPAFAERRLAVRAQKLSKLGCLFAYAVPATAAPTEIDALSEKLWLTEAA